MSGFLKSCSYKANLPIDFSRDFMTRPALQLQLQLSHRYEKIATRTKRIMPLEAGPVSQLFI